MMRKGLAVPGPFFVTPEFASNRRPTSCMIEMVQDDVEAAIMSAVEQEILEAIRLLGIEQQKRVLEFVRTITPSSGTTFAEMREIAREIAFPKEDLEEMLRIIEEEFEQVRGDELDVPDFDT